MVALQIAEIATEKGVNISTIQRDAKIGWDTAERYWHNRHRQINLDILEKIADILGVRVVDLIRED